MMPAWGFSFHFFFKFIYLFFFLLVLYQVTREVCEASSYVPDYMMIPEPVLTLGVFFAIHFSMSWQIPFTNRRLNGS